MGQNAYLHVQWAQGERDVPLGTMPFKIGRHRTNSLVVDDQQASRFHCVIEYSPEGYRLLDLSSSNGTRVNGKLATSVLLKDGAKIEIGQVSFTLHLPAMEEVKAEALTASDVVEGEGTPFLPEASGTTEADLWGYDRVMQRLVESVPPGAFQSNDIALINARGATVHDSGAEPQTRSPQDSVLLLRQILLVCFRTRTSDIHLEPKNGFYVVRVRVDGVLLEVVRLPSQMGVRLSALVKVLSEIDIAHKNIVQEGHFSTQVPGRRVDYRVSFAPSVFGQKLVVRVLDLANSPQRLVDLHLPQAMMQALRQASNQQTGMILVCGPTGSGKTTSLYAMIRSQDLGRLNVVSIEDPVEMQIAGVTQIPVGRDEDKTFSALLRSVLRQDPDVILIGEVRDAETAHIAMQAAITGHLVFSTVHTRDTIGTVFRLLDLGIEPFLIAQGLQVVLAQRLVRQLCSYCKTAVQPSEEIRKRLTACGRDVKVIYEPTGCPRCLGTGYLGRRGVFELLNVTDELKDMIVRKATLQEINKALEGTGFRRLHETGMDLVAEGIVSYQQIEHVVGREAWAGVSGS